ncbi:hypothetical protein [Hymenobacter nivis]|uniref:DoxX family membrane protein n=1 Tax=Hymenobacter nivis TaxID=1850093 RepID=A0A502H0M2_9BACT|nr:hypothetical protein [Hymenobacter nivis]TPG67644.1 hypothetical protein EAH73_06425 [Hymenobacter nivis]
METLETWQAWKRRVLPALAVVYTRYLLGGAFVFASIIKLKGHRFTRLSGAAEPIHSAWHFFETLYKSGLYWQFLGAAQCLAGFLLLTQRFATLGALLFLPIIANVFVITLSYEFGGTPVITGLMLLANALLLAWDWPTLRGLVGRPALPLVPGPQARLWEAVGWALFAFTAGYRYYTDAYNFLLWAGVCTAVGALGLLAAWYLRRRAAAGAPAGGR